MGDYFSIKCDWFESQSLSLPDIVIISVGRTNLCHESLRSLVIICLPFSYKDMLRRSVRVCKDILRVHVGVC